MFNLDPLKLLIYLKSQLTYQTVKKKKKKKIMKSQTTHILGSLALPLAPCRLPSTPLPPDLFHSFFFSLSLSMRHWINVKLEVYFEIWMFTDLGFANSEFTDFVLLLCTCWSNVVLWMFMWCGWKTCVGLCVV